MSLTIYLQREDIPSNVEVIDRNDEYFNVNTVLHDTQEVRNVLLNIDEAEYNTLETFIGRDKALGAIYRENLSTGCKTALNVLEHSEVCFSTIECGPNAKNCILQLKTGSILWYRDFVDLEDDTECDIVCKGVHFTNIDDWLGFIDRE